MVAQQKSFTLLQESFDLKVTAKRPIKQVTIPQKNKLISMAQLLVQSPTYKLVAALDLMRHLSCTYDRAERGIEMMIDHGVLDEVGTKVVLSSEYEGYVV